MDRARLFSVLIFSLLAVYPAVAQNENPASTNQPPRFKSNVRVVLVDVVVTNRKDEPVTGLTKEKFQVFEDGKPQPVASFEEHAGIPDVPGSGLYLRSGLYDMGSNKAGTMEIPTRRWWPRRRSRSHRAPTAPICPE